MSTIRIIPMACAMALAASVAVPAGALSAEHHAGNATTPNAEARTFMQHAAAGGMAEVDLGKLAEQKASNDAVKQFGARMVADHGKANAELKSMAKDKGVTLPTRPDAKHKAEHDRLAKLSGAAFDRAYVSAMAEDHEHDVAEFRKAAESASDPEVKAFAARTLPTLEEHLTMVKQLQAQVASADAGADRIASE
jgi:putative membrane protein